MKTQYASYAPRYAALHCLYQASYTLVVGYASVYLLSRGYTDALIGIILAISNTVAAVIQPTVGTLLDRKKNISLQIFSAVMLFVMAVLGFVLLFNHMSQLPLSILVILIFSLEFSIQPLVNSLCFLLEHVGVSINFGLCRGLGSLTYAVISVILGKVVSAFDESLLPVFYVAVFAALGVCFLSMRTGQTKARKNPASADTDTETDGTDTEEAHPEQAEESLSLPEFVRTYKRFMLFLGGSALIYLLFFAAGNYYVIQIISSIGGDTTEMGLSLGLAAALELPVMALFNKMNKKCPVYLLLRISVIFFILKFLLTLLATNVTVFYVAQIFQMGSYALYYPAVTSYTSRLLPRADLIKGQSLLTCMYTVSGIFASLFGGLLINYTSVHMMLLIFFVISLAGAVITWFSLEKVR